MVPDFLTIAEAGALIAKRELSPVELVQSRLARIERLDGKLNSFIRVLGDAARAAARDPDRFEGHLRNQGCPDDGAFESDDAPRASGGCRFGSAVDRCRRDRARQARDP